MSCKLEGIEWYIQSITFFCAVFTLWGLQVKKKFLLHFYPTTLCKISEHFLKFLLALLLPVSCLTPSFTTNVLEIPKLEVSDYYTTQVKKYETKSRFMAPSLYIFLHPLDHLNESEF